MIENKKRYRSHLIRQNQPLDLLGFWCCLCFQIYLCLILQIGFISCLSLLCFALIWLLNHSHKVSLYLMLLINDKILKDTLFTLYIIC